MLSKQYDIGEFVEKVTGLSFDEVIVLTDKEATETERQVYKDCPPSSCEAARQYAMSLKDFILFMRHGVVTRSTRDLNLSNFREDIE